VTYYLLPSTPLQQPSIINQGETMNQHIDEVNEGLDAAIDTVKALIKVLIVAYNDEITKILVESLKKSQEIESLKDKLTESR
jgi:hypothetical protein